MSNSIAPIDVNVAPAPPPTTNEENGTKMLFGRDLVGNGDRGGREVGGVGVHAQHQPWRRRSLLVWPAAGRHSRSPPERLTAPSPVAVSTVASAIHAVILDHRGSHHVQSRTQRRRRSSRTGRSAPPLHRCQTCTSPARRARRQSLPWLPPSYWRSASPDWRSPSVPSCQTYRRSARSCR